MPHTTAPPTTEAQFWVQLTCNCPTCGDRINLYTIKDARPSIPPPCTTTDIDIRIECPCCTIPFIVNRVTY